jgi:4-hydroxy-3-methylbut-2-enyl diphosphate reductase IspH
MHTLYLKNDGRCKWLERKVLKGYYQEAIKASRIPGSKKIYIIEDWLSNDNGNIGAHKPWLKADGVPVVKTFKDIPSAGDFSVFITPYDSILEEERELRDRGVEMTGEPCPAITKIRNIFEKRDISYQYIFLCDSAHVIMRNYRSLYPEDMILIQMENYKEQINALALDKPFILVPYVTFLPSQVKEIADYLSGRFPDRNCKVLDTYCIWVKSPASPIVEIQNLSNEQLNGVSDALLIQPHNTRNTSASSIAVSLSQRGLHVVPITSLFDMVKYKLKHGKNTVLVVKTPIPNTIEKPVLIYLKNGILAAVWFLTCDYIQRVLSARKLRISS